MKLTPEQTQDHANAVDKALNALLEEIHSTLDGLRQERKRRERANAAEPKAQIDIDWINCEIERLTNLRDTVSKTQNVGIGVRLAFEPGWSTSPSA